MENWPAEETVEFALEVTNTTIWVIDLDTGKSTTLRGPVESLFNAEDGEFGSIERFFEEALHPDDAADVEEIYLDVLRGETEEFKVEFRTHPDIGPVRWIESHGRVRTTEDARLLTGISTEITQRKHREQELEAQNKRLEEVASVLSHDLRNPLNVAEGHVELLQEEQDNRHLEAVERAHGRIESLIESLLADTESEDALAREGRSERLAEVELATVVEECWQNVRTRDATLAVETNVTFLADRSRLAQLLENLIRNAVEHGGSDVTVTVDALDGRDGFYLADDGPGIADAEYESVFEKGYTTSAEGSGLGLHIVKQVADVHGWTVGITESATGGTRVEIAGVST